MKKVNIKFQDDSNGQGWVWMDADREWQPIIGCEDSAEMPTKEDVLLSDTLNHLPDDIDIIVE